MRFKTILVAGAAATTALALAPAATAGAPHVTVKPGALERGPDIVGPHVSGRTIVDGDLRIKVKAPAVELLGTAGRAYVVRTYHHSGKSRAKILRVNRRGQTKTLLHGNASFSTTLSGDGGYVAATNGNARHTRVRTIDTKSGKVESHGRIQGSLSILDYEKNQVLLGDFSRNRTLSFDPLSGGFDLLLSRTGYAASIVTDRIATFTRDPYDGGCTVVTKLSNTDRVLWRSCSQRVQSFNPNGKRMATVGILSDGIGPNVVRVRKTHGRRFATYDVHGYFGRLAWEGGRKLLLDTNARHHAATVRCDKADCELASDLGPVGSPRLAG